MIYIIEVLCLFYSNIDPDHSRSIILIDFGIFKIPNLEKCREYAMEYSVSHDRYQYYLALRETIIDVDKKCNIPDLLDISLDVLFDLSLSVIST